MTSDNVTSPLKKRLRSNCMSLLGFFIMRVGRSLRVVSGLQSNGFWRLLPAFVATGVEPVWIEAAGRIKRRFLCS